MTKIKALTYAQKNHSRYIDQLGEWLTIPSVSTDPNATTDMQTAANWLAAHLQALGLDNVQTFPPDTHPIVYAEHLKAGPDAPTVLIYGHYDVQPATPLDKWDTDPFKPVVRGDNIYARGATDMKGQVLMAVNAVEAILKNDSLPVNVKFMIEGEEEIGSPNLDAFIEGHKDLLACDFCLNPDTGMFAVDMPTITYALRGLAYFELRVFGPAQDLHSGVFGGIVHNPAQALTEIVAGMHDKDGRITLPGFYDSVRELSETERAELARLPINDETIRARAGVSALWGELGYTPVERVGARPTLEVNGLYSGYIEKGAKTVLPAYAMAKISMRLVPDQRPEEVKAQLVAYLEENVPDTIRWELDTMAGGVPTISDIDSKWVKSMMAAQETAWGVKPMFKREGGSVPVVAAFQQILGVESVNIGVGLPDDNMHGPNEKMHLPSFYTGIDALIHFLYNLTDGE